MNKLEKLFGPDFKDSLEPTVALNPLTGLRLSDLTYALKRVLDRVEHNPAIPAIKHSAIYNSKLIRLLLTGGSYEPDLRDKRFKDEAWTENAIYNRLLEAYFQFIESINGCADDIDLNDVDRVRVAFLIRLLGDSLSPTNTLLGNPEATKKAVKTRGRSLASGVKNFVHDQRHNHGIPAQIKPGAFSVGRNIATTQGGVVFRNEVLELIQYTPTTSSVYRRPLVLIPAMINKFYIVDLQPGRSFVEYALNQGLQVFVVSWINPTKKHAHWGVEKYALAILEAINAVKSITRMPDVNLYSICSGAMVSSALAGYLKAIDNNSIHSMTLAVAMLAMEQTDLEIGSFLTPDIFDRVKRRSRKKGILPGPDLAKSMLWMRPRDLVWGNVINNYLLGNEPPEFDLLFWNNDWTNLPAELHCDLIDIFNQGVLSHRNSFEIQGYSLNLSEVDCDKFFVGGASDHITPWMPCYRSVHAFGGNNEFILSKSGHIQTLINTPNKKGTSFLTNKELPIHPTLWLEGVTLHQGSWWPYWLKWITDRSDSKKRAPTQLGNKAYPFLCRAPGTYIY